jgi:hypothetical protein
VAISENQSKNKRWCTYDIVLDSVHDRVDFGELRDGQVCGFLDFALVEVVLDLADLKHTNLLEGPGRQSFGKSLVGSTSGLRITRSLDLSIEPSILQHLSRTEDSETGRVSSLEGGNERQLRARGKDILEAFFSLGVVRVCGLRSTQDRREQGAGVAQKLTDSARDGKHSVDIKVVLDTGLHGLGSGNKQNIVLVGSGLGVVVDVVDDESATLWGKGDIEFEEERSNSGGDGLIGGQSEQDVAIVVDVVDEGVGSQLRTEAL